MHLYCLLELYNYFYWCSWFLCVWIWIMLWGHLLSAWRNSFSVSYKAGWLAINSLSFCLSSFLSLPSFLKVWNVALLDKGLLVGSFFSLSSLNMLFCFLDFIVYAERSTVDLIICKWLVTFLLLLSRFFSCNLTFSIFSMMWLFVSHCIFPGLGVCWASWICRLGLFNTFRKFLVIISSKIFSAPFCLLLMVLPSRVFGIIVYGVPPISEALFIFLHLFFLSVLQISWSVSVCLQSSLILLPVHNYCEFF